MKRATSESLWRPFSMLCILTVFVCISAFGMGACGPGEPTEKKEETSNPPKDAGRDAAPQERDKPKDSDTPRDTDKPKENDPPQEKDVPKEDLPEEPPVDNSKPPTKGSGKIKSAQAVTNGTHGAIDASPSPDGQWIYYIAYKPADSDLQQAALVGQTEGALFKVKSDGSEGPKQIADGFQSPMNIVLSKDGSIVYVADAGAGKRDDDGIDADKQGVIYSISAEGGAKTVLASTRGYQPRGLDLISDPNAQLYFSGTDPADGKIGVFRVGALGGVVYVVTKDSKLKDPSGVTVHANGTVYVADSIGGSTSGIASVIWSISNGQVSIFLDNISVGFPAGIALSQDQKFLLISGLKPGPRTAVLYRAELFSKKVVSETTQGIDQNQASAGLHRAHDRDIFAWSNDAASDDAGKPQGTVYMLTTEKDPKP